MRLWPLLALALLAVGCGEAEMTEAEKGNFKGSGAATGADQGAGMARSMEEFRKKNPEGVIRAPGMPNDPK